MALTVTGGFHSPVVGPNYYPNNADRTPNFYAAGISYATRETLIPTDINPNYTWRINPNSTPQYIAILSDAGGNAISHVTHGIYVWTKDEFLGGFDSAGLVQLEGISVTGSRNGGSASSRLVIRLDTDFFVTDSGAISRSFEDPATLTWYDYDPLTDFTDFSGGVASLTVADFGDLSAVGVYVTNTSTGATSSRRFNNVWVNSIEVTAIPEPASVLYAALGLVLLGLNVYRQRRRQG